jgi:NADH-quinone oxidoreductase subunit F
VQPAREQRVASRNRDRIDPRDISAYVEKCGGYSGLERATGLGPQGVIAELRESGLRGRGGAGYPTAAKWQACRDADGDEKYAVCNAVDSDPLARTARLLLGSDPHSVLEGLLIGAYAVGATRCFVCVNSEYAEEIALVRHALQQMRGRGLLGEDILGAGLSCDIEVEPIAASLVAGEETALLRALETRQALPYLRPPYPVVKGLHGRPTLIDSAETLANVSAILQGHPAAMAHPGTPASPGTKMVTVWGGASSGQARDCGTSHGRTVEIPFGTTIRAAVEAIGGFSPGDPGVKAVQFGGPTGRFFAGSSLDTPITYEDMGAAGSIIGSATIEVLSSGSCAVEMARDAMAYLRDQSCGQCVVCREGTYQMAAILDDIAEFRGEPQHLELLLELGEAMKAGSICGLGKTARAPVVSSIELFAEDYKAHIDDKRCAASDAGE